MSVFVSLLTEKSLCKFCFFANYFCKKLKISKFHLQLITIGDIVCEGGGLSQTNTYLREKLKVSISENRHFIFEKEKCFFWRKNKFYLLRTLFFWKKKKTFLLFFEKECFFEIFFFKISNVFAHK